MNPFQRIRWLDRRRFACNIANRCINGEAWELEELVDPLGSRVSNEEACPIVGDPLSRTTGRLARGSIVVENLKCKIESWERRCDPEFLPAL